MRNIIFGILGIIFGIIMTKSEVISWFRIHEMFRFESFHMFGIIGVAVICGIIIIQSMKKLGINNIDGNQVTNNNIDLNIPRHLLAGSIFGLGWALVGACPGPIYVMIGHQLWIFLFVLLGAVLGAYVYGNVSDKMP